MCYDVKNTSWNEVSRNLDGDNELIHTLYLQLYEKLFRVAYRMMGSSESAEDLVQQTFLLALFQGEALRAHPCPEGWLMKALHNLAINERRRTARRQEIPLDTLFDQAAGEASPPLAETLPLSPSNVYGQHKLEAEARVLARCPDAVALRLPWMYDLPGYHLPIRGNLPLNILKASKTGEVLHFSRNDYRGVSYVREVIENLVPAMELPGGVYNFGSECDGDMVETARCFANLLQVDVKIEESDLTRNLAMDTGKLRAYGIEFSSTWGALRVCLGDYRLGYLM